MGGIPSKEVKSLRDVQPGDHIKYHRLGITYAHHAIVVSVNANNYTVIHFDGDKTGGKNIIQETKHTLSEENFEVLQYPPENRFTREETVAIAYYFLREKFGKYSLFGNNCEHFATTCATGYPCSIQTVRAAIAANVYLAGIPAVIAYCNTKKVVSVKKVNGRYEVTPL